MNIIMSRALQHQYPQRYPQQPPTLTSPLDFTDRIPFHELKLFKETLGSGSFGTVFKGCWKGRSVAVKQFKTREEIDSFLVEVKQLSCVKHPNIVTLYGASTIADTAYLIMEYAEGGSLNHLLHESKQQQYDLRHACSWAMQTAKGVAYLHSIRPKPIMHRDLKPANLLLFSRGKILKICDFGTACTVKTQMTNNTGSASYMAPEVFATSSYLESGDVYSWSIIFWEILARKHPYASHQYSNPYQILWSVKEEGTRPDEIDGCPELIWNLITQSWNKHPLSRPTMQGVAEQMEFIFSLTEKQTSIPSPNTTTSILPPQATTNGGNKSISTSPQLPTNHHHKDKIFPICSRIEQCRKTNLSFTDARNLHQDQNLSGCELTMNTTTSTKKELYFHSKALLHRLELLQVRKEELEKLVGCDKRNTTWELVNEFEELKRETDSKKKELEQRQSTSSSTMNSRYYSTDH